ncbi:MAG TPA: hypothetical protein VMY42_12620 [Thermoguttaceae bacterium]|nr:hypothetical protein [Thermoguttaceae bacterium]
MSLSSVLLHLLIVAIGPKVPIEDRYPEATEVFHCTFDRSWDANFNGWPDRWTRRRGPGYPHYVKIEINEEPSPAGDRCLRIDVDGGAAAVFSPPVQVGSLFSYVLEGYLKTQGLQYDRAFFSLTLLDDQRVRLQTFYSEKVRHTDGWIKFRLGPISPRSDNVRYAMIGLHVEPGEEEDLRGSVSFDDVWLGRLPRIALRTGDPYNFFTDPGQVEIHCTVSGSLERDPTVEFELEDVSGRTLARLQRQIPTRPADTGEELSLESLSEQPQGRIGETTWKPPLLEPGFYRVRATMKGRAKLVQRRELNLVVIEPRRSPAGGEFGWTLPRGDKPLPLPLLGQLIAQAGINWVKYPFWYGEDASEESIERLIAFAQRLSVQGIELVGLLHQPPDSLRSRYAKSGPLSVVDIFAPGPEVWYPSLEPVMTRLATRVHWWQLGADTDASLVGYPNLSEKIAQIKGELDRIGQDVNLGIGWNWINDVPAPAGGKAPWRSLTFSADPPLTHAELSAYLEAHPGGDFRRWVVVEPLPADAYDVEARADDLVRRMIVAKIQGADAVFCPDPFDAQRGLMNADGTPGELFLPWRTAALALGGARYIGSIELPEGSRNQIFARDEDAVMVVWNEQPTEEVLYLGENVRQIDLFGRSREPARRDHRQVIRVGPFPSFVTGLNEPITRWRMSLQLARSEIPSVFGRPQSNSFALKNPFSRGVSGEAELITPEVWSVTPSRAAFRLEAGESLRHDFQTLLSYNASSGRHRVRVDFEIYADRPYRFSVYRKMDVGMGNVGIEVSTRLAPEGELEVQQRLINETDTPVSFRCQLYAPGRRRLKMQIIGLGRGRDVQLYRMPRGEELLGKTLWIRAEEIDGPRVLNYRFVAKS